MTFLASTPENFELATSYLSLEEADELIKAQRDGSQWLSLENDEDKQVLLMQASFGVDGIFSYQFLPTIKNQLLKFPRNGLKTIPNSVKLATALLGVRFTVEYNSESNIKSEKIGQLQWTLGGVSNTNTKQIEDIDVLTLLRPLQMRTKILL